MKQWVIKHIKLALLAAAIVIMAVIIHHEIVHEHHVYEFDRQGLPLPVPHE